MIYEILFILLLVGFSCALMGSLLFLNESLMIADAISHTILLGIVVAYYFTEDLSSPWLIIGASAFGVLTVYAIELLVKSKRVEYDGAIGLVFPFFFSIAVIIISKFYRNVHLDIDMVLLGQVELAPLKRMTIGALNLPESVVTTSVVLIINILFILWYNRSLKIMLFDPIFARTSGIKVAWINFLMMSLVSLTAVSSFESVGSILVIALMAAPVMTARLWSRKFNSLLINSLLVTLVNCIIGFTLGIYLNLSVSSLTAVVSFINFLIVFVIKLAYNSRATAQN